MIQKTRRTNLEKELIVAEYLSGQHTYRQLGDTYGIGVASIHLWVRNSLGTTLKKAKPATPSKPEEILPTDVKQLQEALRLARLHNELLNTMIDLAEDQLKIDIRKKSGTKR